MRLTEPERTNTDRQERSQGPGRGRARRARIDWPRALAGRRRARPHLIPPGRPAVLPLLRHPVPGVRSACRLRPVVRRQRALLRLPAAPAAWGAGVGCVGRCSPAPVRPQPRGAVDRGGQGRARLRGGVGVGWDPTRARRRAGKARAAGSADRLRILEGRVAAAAAAWAVVGLSRPLVSREESAFLGF
jgi:hypothetical protein